MIHFCGKQGNNSGNFLAMIKIFAAEGTIIHDHISRPLLRNATYIHHSSQNEMIEVIVKSIIQQDLFE